MLSAFTNWTFSHNSMYCTFGNSTHNIVEISLSCFFLCTLSSCFIMTAADSVAEWKIYMFSFRSERPDVKITCKFHMWRYHVLANVYEINHIGELRKWNQMKNDPHSCERRNLCNCVRSLKNISGLHFDICFRSKAHLVFLWYVYNKMFYLSQGKIVIINEKPGMTVTGLKNE